MAMSLGWDPPGLPPTAVDGRPTVPAWMGGVGIGQLQVLSLYHATENKRLSAFVVGKSMQDRVGEIEETTTEADGMKYVLKVRDAGQVGKLLSMTELFDHTPVKVEVHPILNKRRCVISCREIQQETEDELLKWLGKEGVIAVRRIKQKNEKDEWVNSPTLILTINGTAVPETIKVGPLRVRTRIYIPDPMLCYKCYAYGHSKFRCKAVAKCRNCSKPHSFEGECKETPYCHHCQGNHGPAFRKCPIYQMEKEIVRLRFTKGISYQEAMKQFKAGGGSYASVSKVQQRLNATKVAPQESAQLKEKDELIAKLLDTIEKLNTRVEELEKKQQQKKMKKDRKKANRRERERMEESASEMETDTSNKLVPVEAPVQVGGVPSEVEGHFRMSNVQKVHKRHPTTEIHPPVCKKTPTNPEFTNIPCPLKTTLNSDANYLPFPTNTQLVQHHNTNYQNGSNNSNNKQK